MDAIGKIAANRAMKVYQRERNYERLRALTLRKLNKDVANGVKRKVYGKYKDVNVSAATRKAQIKSIGKKLIYTAITLVTLSAVACYIYMHLSNLVSAVPS